MKSVNSNLQTSSDFQQLASTSSDCKLRQGCAEYSSINCIHSPQLWKRNLCLVIMAPISAPPSTKALLRKSRWSAMEWIMLPNTFTTQNSITNTHQYLASTQASLPAELRLMDIVNYGASLVTFPLGKRPAGGQTGIICTCGLLKKLNIYNI